MNRITLTYLTIILFCSSFTMPSERPAYLKIHKEIAIQEMNRSGIPASIILAQAIVESAWGKATLALAANNHFGIKCKADWMGSTFFLEDDDYDREGNLIESCFRAYPDVLSSYRDHSDFLMNGTRYQMLFDLPKDDYRAWAHGLKACGYATDPLYAEKLIKKIEQYRLYDYDSLVAIMEAPSFSIPFQSSNSMETDTSKEPEQHYPGSLIINDDFGLIDR